MNSKNDKIMIATKHQPPHISHLLPFYTFDTSFTQVFVFFLFDFHLYTRSSPPSDLLPYHHSTKSFCLSLPFRPPPLAFLSH